MRRPRRYGKWAGDPEGTAEDPTRCVEEVYPQVGLHYQCGLPAAWQGTRRPVLPHPREEALSYDELQAGATYVICTICGQPYFATHHFVPYVCIACR